MHRKIAVAILLLAAGSAAATTPPISPADLLGTWRCGPTVMQGPRFTVTVIDKTTKLPNGAFNGYTRSVISAPGEAPSHSKIEVVNRPGFCRHSSAV